MANHSFSRLTANIGRNYFVTNDTKSKLNLQYCPCSKNCGEQIIFDSTGIGSEFLWYGRPDIMMLPMGGVSGIIVPEQSEDEDDKLIQEFCPELENHKSVVEVKPSYSLRVEKNVQQIVSIAITFSMFQNISQLKMNLGQRNFVSLVPIIASSSRNFDIYLYDAKNDILLRNMGAPIPLWEDERVTKKPSKLKMSSILNFV